MEIIGEAGNLIEQVMHITVSILSLCESYVNIYYILVVLILIKPFGDQVRLNMR